MKMMKRIFTLIIALSLITAYTLNVGASSQNVTESTANSKAVATIDSSDYTLDNLPSFIQETIKANDKVAESLDLEFIEDPYTFIVNNEDGTKTQYRYDIPVKHKDGNKISFRNPKIAKANFLKRVFTKYEYESVENDIKSYFPQKLKDGVLLEYKDYSVEVSPVNNVKFSSGDLTANTEQNIAKYTNVFTSKDYVEYIPVVNGLKENIVLNEYTGVNTFKFTVNIKGLVPAFMEGESIPLLDKESNELIMAIGQVDVKDSYDGKNENNDVHFSIYNSLSLEKTDVEDEYLLTVVVDKEFLESETTVYPVTIDPNIELLDTSVMRDTTVYSGMPDRQTFYTSNYNIVGNHGGSYGEGIAFFQILVMHCYKHINPEKISNAFYYVREGSGKTNSSILEIHDVYDSWDETTITYNNKPETYAYPSYNAIEVTISQWYNVDITYLVQDWLRTELNEADWNQTHGFALVARDSTASSKHFCSASNSTYPPSLSITYTEDSGLSNGVYYIKNVLSNKYLDVENPTWNGGSGTNNVIVHPLHRGTNQQWCVVSQGDGFYKLYTRWKFSMQKCLDITGENIDVYDDTGGEYLLFRIIKNNDYYYDDTYRIMPVYNGNTYQGLDVNWASDSPDYQRNVSSYIYLGQDNQKWEFEQVTPLIGQETRYWCWAASVLMSANTYGTVNVTQSQIVQHVSPGNNDGMGSVEETLEAVEYASGYTDFTQDDALTQSELNLVLDSGHPVIVLRVSPYITDNTRMGHAFVICGYYIDGSEARYIIKDPWPEYYISNDNYWPTPNEGQVYEMSYPEIVDGSYSGIDNKLWTYSVYRETGT